MNDIVQNYFNLYPFPHPIDIKDAINKGLRESYDIVDEKKYIFPDDIDKRISNVLITGCGFNQALYHATRNPKISFTAVDFSNPIKEHINLYCDEHKVDNLSFIYDDYISLNNIKFDLIYATDVINYSKTPKDSLLHLHSLLNDNGALILSLPSSYYYDSIELIKKNFNFLELSFESNDDIDFAFNLVKGLLSVHPSKVNIHDLKTKEIINKFDFIYRFMTPINNHYNIHNLFDLISSCDLFFQNWNYNSDYSPKALFWDENINLPGIINKFDDKDLLQTWDTVLNIKGPFSTSQKLTFSLRKKYNPNFMKDIINHDDSLIYIRPNHIIQKNPTLTATFFSRTNYKRTLKEDEEATLALLSKPTSKNNLLKLTDYSLDELNDILDRLWAYSAISYYKE